MTSNRKVLVDILESQSFDRLEPFKKSKVWESLEIEERTLLARLLVMQGASQLAQGDQKALESFDHACKISSSAPEVLFLQANILSSYRENIRCLHLASQTLITALEKSPFSSDGWYLRAQILIDIAHFEGEASLFIEANECFDRLVSLWEQNDDLSIRREECYWKWGVCLASLGKLSGEPIDYYRAIEKFRQAHDCGCHEVEFFNDFGLSLSDLGLLLEAPEYLSEALVMFNQAIDLNPEAFNGWYNQASCIKSLIDFKGYGKLLDQAHSSFMKASQIDPECGQLWLKWGQLETISGKLKRDSQRLEASLLKYDRANQLDPGNPHILSSWAESELCLGAEEERLELIQSARHKILNSLEILPEDPNSWYVYGSCLNELGCYFGDEDYYTQAIEKFKYGLSLTRHHPLLWYGLALSNFALGESSEEQLYFEKSIRYCARVVECGGEGFPQFWNDWGVALLKIAEMTQQASYVESAIEKFEKALKLPLQQVEGEDLDLEWVYNYSCAFDLLGDLKEEPHYFEKAVQIFTQILQLDPNYMMARYNLALAFSHLGEALYDIEYYQKAIEQFQILLDFDPEDEMILLDFGMSLTNLGLLVHDIHHPERSQTLYRQAESSMMQAVALGNTQAFYQLAGLYSITSHYHQAMHYLERAQFCDTLPGIEDLMHDEWLDGLRRTPSFRQFINELSSRQSTDDK